jgi:hypothetical protein
MANGSLPLAADAYSAQNGSMSSSLLYAIIHFRVNNKLCRNLYGQECVGKKTALLQAEASACVSGLANVLFCALAVHFIVFLFCLFSSKLSAVSFFLHLAVTVEAICSKGLRATILSIDTKV